MRTRLIVFGLAAILIAMGTGWFIANFELRKEQEFVGFQGKARRDPWLAAEKLLQRMGGQAQAVRSLPEAASLPRSATLFLPRGRQSFDAKLRTRILAWVRQGGRLIVEAEPPYQHDPLLDAFGVQRTAVKFTPAGKGEMGITMPVEITLPTDQPPVTVVMTRLTDLRAKNALAQFGAREITTVLLLEAGRGRVLVMNDFTPLSNRSIGEHGHAEFLWRLVQVDYGKPSAYFFYDPKKLSLVEWFRENAIPAVAGLALLLLALLWRAVPRFGPIVPDPDRTRRRLLDHLRASGRFLWQHGGSHRLAESAREACLRRIARAHPELPGADDPQFGPRVAELFELDADQSRLLLAPEAPARALEFLQTIRLYQAIHEKLALRQATKQPRGKR